MHLKTIMTAIFLLLLMTGTSPAAFPKPVEIQAIQIFPDETTVGKHPEITGTVKAVSSKEPGETVEIIVIASLARPDHTIKSWTWKKINIKAGETKAFSIPKEYEVKLTGIYKVDFGVYSTDMRPLGRLSKSFTVVDPARPRVKTPPQAEARSRTGIVSGKSISRPADDRHVTPDAATIGLGAPVQYTATGNFSDGSSQDLTTQVTWKSTIKTVATVSNAAGSRGLVTPVAGGVTTISATHAATAITGLTTLTVSSATLTSIVITPANPSVNASPSQSVQFTATGYYSDGSWLDLTKSTSMTWSSSNTAFATITNVPKKNKGLATGVSAGTVDITAQMKGSISGTTTLTVN